MNYFDHSTLRQVLCVAEARKSLELASKEFPLAIVGVPSPKITWKHQIERTGPIGLDTKITEEDNRVSHGFCGRRKGDPIFTYIRHSS